MNERERIETVERILGYRFRDRDLIDRALTHPSFSNEPDCECDYERLEFLGDAVLGLIVVEDVYVRFPQLPEGVMTKVKIAVVAGTTLAEVAEELGLQDLIRLGASERGTGGRGMASALENAFEALVGALYLDGGLEVARRFVLDVMGPRIIPEAAETLEHPKSRLQELIQARGTQPDYNIIATTGPPHDRVFTAEVRVDGELLGTGSGRSKKEAEMSAAAQAIEGLTA